MKKSELKNIIKECVKEVLFEEGVLSNLVAEVAFGISKAQGQLLETKSQETKIEQRSNNKRAQEEKQKKLLETKRKMLDAIGGERMKGVFEGTQPLRNPSESSQHSPLAGTEPGDAGVDISGLFSLAGQRWQNLK